MDNRCAVAIVLVNMRDNLSYYESESEGKSVAIVGVPMGLGSDERGLQDAPRYLLDHGLEDVIASIGAEITDIIMVPCRNPERVVSAGYAKYLDEVIAASRVSSVVVGRAVRRGDFVLALGGDHSIALGTIAGAATALEHRTLGVIWIDAHPDANTDTSTFSGNIHGMPAAALMGFGHTCLLAGIDVVEIHPAKDEKEKTTTLAFELIALFLGGKYSWYEKYMDDYRHTNISNERTKVRRSK